MNVLITGASGSGTTTLGKYTADKLKWNFIDTDDYYWLPTDPPYEKERDSNERLDLILDEIKKHDSNVIAGSVMEWGEIIEESFDLITFLYLNTSIRVDRLKKREKANLGRVDREFIKWASEYDTGPEYGRSYAKHKVWLAKRKCRVIRIEGDLTTERRYRILLEAISKIRITFEGEGQGCEKTKYTQ